MALSTTTGQAIDSPRARRVLAASNLGLVCTGLYATAFGPALPFLADDFGVSLDSAGLLLTALFLGSITASASLAFRFHRLEPRLVGAAGLLVVASGLVLLGVAPSWQTALGCAVLLGLGDGLLVASAHAIAASVAANPGAAINRLNLYFAFGATVGPIWSGAILSQTGERGLLFAGIALVALIAAVLLIAGGNVPARHTHDTSDPLRPHGATPWVMGAVLCLYVGAEFGLGSWVSSYSKDAFGTGVMAGAFVTAGYWGALAVGRMVSTSLFERGQRSSTVLSGAIVGALITSTILVASGGHAAAGITAALATGFFFGPIWPSAIAAASERARANAPALMVTVGNAGGLVFPWLQGRVLVSSGSSSAIAVTAVLCLGMLLVAGA
ncbi:MAG: MFS transporter, partial [Tepidiformaceae bacterium]